MWLVSKQSKHSPHMVQTPTPGCCIDQYVGMSWIYRVNVQCLRVECSWHTFIFCCCLFRGSMCHWKVLVLNLRSRHSALRPAGYEQSAQVCMCLNRSRCCYQPSHLVGTSDVVLPAGLHVCLTHNVLSVLCLLLGHLVFTGLTSASSFAHGWQVDATVYLVYISMSTPAQLSLCWSDLTLLNSCWICLQHIEPSLCVRWLWHTGSSIKK